MARPDISGLKVSFSEQWLFGNASHSNDGCLVPDPDAGGYICFYGTPDSGGGIWWENCAIGNDPTNPSNWGNKTTIENTSSGYQKPYILQDLDGNPVKVGGVYYLYMLDSGRTNVYIMTASTLSGTWTIGASVFIPQAGQSNILVMSAAYVSSTVYLLYSYEPSSSDPTFLYGSRARYATCATPGGTFADVASLLDPSTNSSSWRYGWIGGIQVMNRAGGGYQYAVNASSTQPSSERGEPAPSLIGFFYSPTFPPSPSSLVESTTNPIPIPTTYTGIVPLENTNLWRVQLQWDSFNSQWLVCTNTGVLGTEYITLAVLSSTIGNYNWSVQVDDTFHRANSGTVGNGWTDQQGIYSISSNELVGTPGSGWNLLYRPAGEAAVEQLIVIYYVASNDDSSELYYNILRSLVQSNTAPTHYYMRERSGGVECKSVVAGSENTITNGGTLTSQSWSSTSGHAIRAEFAIRKTPSAPTTSVDLYGSAYDETASTTFFVNGMGSDTAASLQNNSGQLAINVSGSFTGTWTEITCYQLAQTDGLPIQFPGGAVTWLWV